MNVPACDLTTVSTSVLPLAEISFATRCDVGDMVHAACAESPAAVGVGVTQ